MKIIDIQSYPGRNIYSHKPVVKMTVDLGKYGGIQTCDIPGFNDSLLGLFPGLSLHECGIAVKRGFMIRLKEGTYPGHVIEHLALELQMVNGHDVRYGKTRVIQEPSLYYIVFEVRDEKCGVECAKAAFKIVGSLLSGVQGDCSRIIDSVGNIFREEDPGPGTSALLQEAAKRGIPIMSHGDNSLIQLGYGKYARNISGTLTDHPACTSVDTASNKQLTKKILKDHGIPMPYGNTVYTAESAIEAAIEIGYPVVIKPCDANQGKGVSMNIRAADEIPAAFGKAAAYSRAVMVEKMISGKDYRLLVVGDRVCAASERTPPFVAGDGRRSIKQLIESANMDPMRGEHHEKPLTKIKVDDILAMALRKSSMTIDSIPALGETVFLRDNANLSTGGTARDCTGEVHPRTVEMAVRSAAVLGLDVAGVDIAAADISLPIDGKNGAVIEINAAPGIRMHLYPSSGCARNVASDIMDLLFPISKPSSIPIVSITGTNGKTTTARIIRHTLALTGMTVGMTCTSGSYIGDICVLKGDNAGPASARVVLSDRSIDAAVLETARGGIIRKGLGYDLADVGVITNISDDHLGSDGINTIEQLAFVKAIVAEAVKPDGYAVLNADDPMTPYVSGRVNSNLILFSRNPGSLLLKEHVKRQGKAVYTRNSRMYYYNGIRNIPLMDVTDIPITYMSTAGFNIENSLAAVAALFAMNVPTIAVKKGLRTFLPDIGSNPGRINMFDLGEFKVMVDYGHNAAGYRAVIETVKSMGIRQCTGVIGMPGDRMDGCIFDVGRICGQFFSRLYIKEDRDLRGRNRGETAGLLYKGAVSGGMLRGNITTVLSEIEALETAISDASPGDLIIIFHEEFEPVLEILTEKMNGITNLQGDVLTEMVQAR